MAAICPNPGAAGRLRVAAVQMVFAPTMSGNLGKISRAATQAAHQGADVVLFPECAITGYGIDFAALQPATLRQVLQQVAALAGKLNIHLLLGTPMFAGRKLFNTLAVFSRAGRLAHVHAKCQLTEGDRQWFKPGNSLSLFTVDGVRATAIICHERRYPELVRLPVMAGAQVVFHPNAGMDPLPVSRAKRGGRDGIPARAFENAVYYVFANSVGRQGGGKWSAGDSKIVAPGGEFLKLAGNETEAMLVQDLDLSLATRRYALDSLRHPRFLAAHWPGLLGEMRERARTVNRLFQAWFYGRTSGTP